MATARRLCDKPECPICKEVYTDPRVLPCGHTFCRQCIGAFREQQQQQQQQQLACLLCRKVFRLPANGVGDLPKNFAVLDILQSKELPSGCEACSGDVVKAATSVYCVECEQKLCRDCEEDHKKFSVTRRPKSVDVNAISTGLFIVKLAE